MSQWTLQSWYLCLRAFDYCFVVNADARALLWQKQEPGNALDFWVVLLLDICYWLQATMSLRGHPSELLLTSCFAWGSQ